MSYTTLGSATVYSHHVDKKRVNMVGVEDNGVIVVGFVKVNFI
ncbi:hypothetical protein [Bacillus sp. OTU530]